MSATTMPNADSSDQWLVQQAHRSIPVERILVLPFIGVIYATIAFLHPIYGESPLSVVLLTLLTMLTAGYALMSPNADILDPMRVVSFYFLVIFCIAPLALEEVSWHYTRPYVELLPGAVTFSLVAYVMFVIGYHLPLFGRLPESIPARHERYDNTVASIAGLMLLAIGLASWAMIIVRAGGTEGLLYSDLARGEFFIGFGYFFWGALFMFPGATLYWSSRCVGKRRAPWHHALPLVLAFSCFLVLQGRMRALNFLILGIFVAHYMIKPIKPTRLAIFGLGGGFLALFIGIARAPSTRVDAFLNPIALLNTILSNLGAYVKVFLSSDFSRLQQIALILDKVPAWMPYDLGQSYFLFLNPWLRLFGLIRFGGIEGIGPRLFRLAHPEIGYLPTGYLPSFMGEALVNFPWFIAWVLFIPYGIALRFFYMRLIVRRGDFFSVTIYAIVLLQSANIMLQSFGHVVFEMMIVLLPFIVVQFVARRRQPNTHAMNTNQDAFI